MNRPDWKASLGAAFDHALAYLDGLPERPVSPSASLADLRATLGGPLPARPVPPEQVVAELAAAAEPGVVASSSGRYFGFVVGGATPAALARGLAHLSVGPERRPVRPRPRGERRGRGLLCVACRAAGPASAGFRRIRDRCADGQLHGARHSGPRRAAPHRLGRRRRRAVGRTAGAGTRRRRPSRHDRPGVALPRHGHRVDRRSGDGRAGPDDRPGPGRGARSEATGRPSCARRPAM